MGSIITSYDVHANKLPIIEIYGTEGTLSVPDPNAFDGPVMLYRPESKIYMEIPITFGYAENSRGLGLADMANAIQAGRKARAGVDLTYHVLEVMTGFIRSSDNGKHEHMTTAPDKPMLMEAGFVY